ncbi:MAG TPA: hypothetical protein DHV36_22170 [Desulfobacteraceae bacterium]|nr:hypothetical protein [Desulfobacteraceae bacterium]
MQKPQFNKKYPPVNEVVKEQNGFMEFDLSCKKLSLKKQADGSISLYVSQDRQEVLFTLDRGHAEHLIRILKGLTEDRADL